MIKIKFIYNKIQDFLKEIIREFQSSIKFKMLVV